MLKVCDVCKSYGNADVLKNINIEFTSGEIHAILGGNGVGKSTLINIIAGIIRMNSGSIYLDGEKVEITSPYEAKKYGIAVCPQDILIFDELSIANNLFIGNETTYNHVILDREEMLKEAGTILKRLGINAEPQRNAAKLSLAEKYLIQFARILLSKPKIIMLDELTDSLTGSEKKIVYEILNEMKDKGVAIIYITHQINEALTIADKISVIKDGKIAETVNNREANLDTIAGYLLGEDVNIAFPKLPVTKREVLLEVDNISNLFLNSISFSLKRGEMIGIAGMVGSGRSSLLRAIIGLDKISEGEIRFFSERSTGKKSHRRRLFQNIGYIPENREDQGLFPKMSISKNIVIRNIRKVTRFHFISLNKEKMESRDMVDRLGIKISDINDRVFCLSGGNKQKIMVARCVFSNCSIYVFDEPTKGIDTAGKVEIYNIFNELLRKGAGIIVVSSDFAELEGMCDRILFIKKGRIVAECNSKDIGHQQIISVLGES